MGGGSFNECLLGYAKSSTPTKFQSLTPGGLCVFTSYYSVGSQNLGITWNGTIDKLGQKIGNGTFSHAMGTGTFVATRVCIQPTAPSTLTVAKGKPTPIGFALSVAPPITTHGKSATVTATLTVAATAGDAPPATLSVSKLHFTTADWITPHLLECTAEPGATGPIIVNISFYGFLYPAAQTLTLTPK